MNKRNPSRHPPWPIRPAEMGKRSATDGVFQNPCREFVIDVSYNGGHSSATLASAHRLICAGAGKGGRGRQCDPKRRLQVSCEMAPDSRIAHGVTPVDQLVLLVARNRLQARRDLGQRPRVKRVSPERVRHTLVIGDTRSRIPK